MSKFEILKCLYNICWDLLREITVSNSFWREGSITIIVHCWFHSVSSFNCLFVFQLLLIGCSIVAHWLFNYFSAAANVAFYSQSIQSVDCCGSYIQITNI